MQDKIERITKDWSPRFRDGWDMMEFLKTKVAYFVEGKYEAKELYDGIKTQGSKIEADSDWEGYNYNGTRIAVGQTGGGRYIVMAKDKEILKALGVDESTKELIESTHSATEIVKTLSEVNSQMPKGYFEDLLERIAKIMAYEVQNIDVGSDYAEMMADGTDATYIIQATMRGSKVEIEFREYPSGSQRLTVSTQATRNANRDAEVITSKQTMTMVL